MRFHVVGIGEVLWDLLPGGPQLGGAPANFVYHASALGARASLVTRVGKDDLGTAIRARASSRPTTVVDTIGAGDAFAAALVLGMLSKMPLASINALADEVARHVCSCAGATPQLPRRLVERFGVGVIET